MTLKKLASVFIAAVFLFICCGCKADEPIVIDPNAGNRCYNHLSDAQKQIYAKAVNAVENMQRGLVELGDYSQQDATLACRAVLSDRPDFFWMPEGFIFEKYEGTAYIAFGYKTNSYLMPSEQLRAAQDQLDAAIAEINKGIVSGMSDFDKELYYHNWLCQNIKYAESTEDNMVYTAYGALVNGSAVCEGYARAMQLLCLSQKIDCHVVYGSAQSGGEYIGHMWNQIRLDGKFYNLDVTLDDRGDTANFEYFNLTDKQLSATHAFDRDFSLLTATEKESANVSFNIGLPACTALSYNYYNIFPTVE